MRDAPAEGSTASQFEQVTDIGFRKSGPKEYRDRTS